MDDNRHQASTSSSGIALCSKPGQTDIRSPMEPGDATSSRYEDAVLREKILRVLSGTYKSSDITFLYTNENFLHDPSSLSYYEDEAEVGNSVYNEVKNTQREEAVQATVSLVYFPREQHAELVDLMKKRNILQRFFRYIWYNLGCGKPRGEV